MASFIYSHSSPLQLPGTYSHTPRHSGWTENFGAQSDESVSHQRVRSYGNLFWTEKRNCWSLQCLIIVNREDTTMGDGRYESEGIEVASRDLNISFVTEKMNAMLFFCLDRLGEVRWRIPRLVRRDYNYRGNNVVFKLYKYIKIFKLCCTISIFHTFMSWYPSSPSSSKSWSLQIIESFVHPIIHEYDLNNNRYEGMCEFHEYRITNIYKYNHLHHSPHELMWH